MSASLMSPLSDHKTRACARCIVPLLNSAGFFGCRHRDQAYAVAVVNGTNGLSF